ncbi:MAG: FAD-binding oxidoreductase [Candidatus Brocadiae bacterium]|nr:FAD-binding oxidoreductase [Candidatus Brocadiia bacterium]
MNELAPRPPGATGTDYRKVTGAEKIRQAYAEYLHDESRLCALGDAEGAAGGLGVIHFPTTAEEVAGAVRAARRAGHRVAISGARTGITGAAVPLNAEEIISLERIKPKPVARRDEQGNWAVRVGAGTTVAELTDALQHGLCEYPDGKPDHPVFYPVDTTETSAQVGGTVATNASGARTFSYGPTRRWVNWLKVVTPDGRILELRRGDVLADGHRLFYRREDGSHAELHIPDLPMPGTKHTAGYHLRPGMDAIELFIGSEGTLGIVAEAELRLAKKPANRLFLTQFVSGPDVALGLVRACKDHPRLSPLALEYIGPRSMGLLRAMGRESAAYVEVARLPADARAALYVEVAFRDEEELDAIYAALGDVLAAEGVDPAHSWAGFTDRDMEEMKRLRHAVPETVNGIIGRRKSEVPELHKVGTDMAVPDESLGAMMKVYDERLEASGLDFVIFGHIGDGHLHVNILPKTTAELAQAEALYADFAAEAVRLGGSVAAEHGIGRIKKRFLAIQYSEEDLAAMRAVKDTLDPAGTLNPGVLFDRR